LQLQQEIEQLKHEVMEQNSIRREE